MASKESVLNGYGFLKSFEVENSRRFCDPCKFTGRKTQAQGYCKTCDGHLCKDCLKAHKASLDTRKHIIIPKAKYSNSEGSDVLLRCEEHQATLESYCSDHDKLCCHECISVNHRTCSSLIPIQRAACGIRDGSNISDLTSELDSLLTQFMRLKKEEENEMKTASKQGEDLANQVREFRKRINTILDKAEAAIYARKEQICKSETVEVFGRYKICENAIPALEQARKRLNRLNKDTPEQNSFIVTKKVENVVQRFQPVLKELGDRRGAFSVKFVPNQDLVRAVQSLGSIVVRSTEHVVSIDSPKDATSSVRKLKQCREINVKGNSDKKTCTITGCTFLKDNRLVIVDETNKDLKLIGDNHRVTHFYTLDDTPWDVVALSDNMVAVRSSFTDNENDENAVQIVSLKSEIKSVTQFKVDGRPRAIAYSEPNLYVACTYGEASVILVLDGNYKVVQRVQPEPGTLRQPQYMAINKTSGKLYISDFYKGVLVLDLRGGMIAELKESNLTEFGGLTMDSYGDVYLCAGKPYGVYKLSKDCKSVAALVTWGDGQIDPQAIAYSAKTDSFVVTSCSSNRAYVFSYINTANHASNS